jgi:hypothetical protein
MNRRFPWIVQIYCKDCSRGGTADERTLNYSVDASLDQQMVVLMFLKPACPYCHNIRAVIPVGSRCAWCEGAKVIDGDVCGSCRGTGRSEGA